ncbi:MAG: hypothetical protein J7D61_14540 [Marichromatium sp.]|nr:hypothetical protein [Marichromatium sp.]
MKVQGHVGTNINHIRQQKISTPTPAATQAVEKTSDFTGTTPTSTLTHQLKTHNSAQGFLQALHQGLQTLDEKMDKLISLAKNPQEEREVFGRIQEEMMDIVDNTVYGERPLFHAPSLALASGDVPMPSFSFLEGLDIGEEAELHHAKAHIGEAMSLSQHALQTNAVASINTLSALSALPSPAVGEDASAHDMNYLKERMWMLLKDA